MIDSKASRVSSLWGAALVFVLTLGAYSFELGDAPLAGTEGHRALTAHQMVLTRDWILPHLYDQLYLKKPPLCYWIIALFEKLTGRANEWVWRLPSAAGAAALGAGLCLFADAWFGSPAGLVAGVAHLSMIALWAQNRSADIDSLNSLASVMAACGIVQMQTRRDKSWLAASMLTGVAVGASLLLKGPAGLTVVFGALLGPAVAARDARLLRSTGGWVSLLVGGALCGVYVLAARHAIAARHLTVDWSGIAEAADKGLPPHRPLALLLRYAQALLLPPTLLAYALPASVALPAALHRSCWNAEDATYRLRLRASVGAVGGALAVALLSGMVNPRYGYVILPTICPVVGGVFVQWRRAPAERVARTLHAAIGVCGGLFAGVAVVLASRCAYLRLSQWPAAMAAAGMAVAVVVIAARRVNAATPVAAGVALVAVLLLAMAPFAIANNADVRRRSAYAAAARLAAVVPPGTIVTTGVTVMDQPELFYYARVGVDSDVARVDSPLQLSPGRWVVLKEDDETPRSHEISNWKRDAPEMLSHWTDLWPGKPIELAYYGPPPGAASRPAPPSRP